MNILIAGSSGIIGNGLTSKLLDYGNIYGINKNSQPNDVDVVLDLTNADNLNYFPYKEVHFDALIFLVGLAHSKGSKGTELLHHDTNFLSLSNLLNFMNSISKLPKKIIFASTISVYGENINKTKFLESDNLYPASPYAVSKLKAEEYLNKNFADRCWILRFAPVYGKNFRLNIDRRTKINEFFFRVGDGQKKMSLCNIQNIYDTIKSILDGTIPPDTYNVSDTAAYNYNDLLKANNATNIIKIPFFMVYSVYLFGKFLNINYLIENSIKLYTNCIYPSAKISNYVELKFRLEKMSND